MSLGLSPKASRGLARVDDSSLTELLLQDLERLRESEQVACSRRDSSDKE
jgi:hypothetical protein